MAMTANPVQEIEQAIKKLSPAELDDLYSRLADYPSHPFDERIAADLDAGRLDKVLLEVLEDEKNGRFGPL
jgi:hypothetical protein